MTTQSNDQFLGRTAYEAYVTQTGGVSLVSGEQLPLWEDLDDSMQTAWIAAARTVLANASGLMATEIGTPTVTAAYTTGYTTGAMSSPPEEPEDEGDEVPSA